MAKVSEFENHPSHSWGWLIPLIIVLLAATGALAWGIKQDVDRMARQQQDQQSQIDALTSSDGKFQLELDKFQQQLANLSQTPLSSSSASGLQAPKGRLELMGQTAVPVTA